MKRYRFRLEQVLRVRRIQQDQAAAAVGVARRGLERAAEDVEARVLSYADQGRAAAGPVTVARFAADRALWELRADALRVAQHRHEVAADELALRMHDWAGAAQRVKGLERLDQHRRADHAIEAGRDEAREADDMVSARFRPTPATVAP